MADIAIDHSHDLGVPIDTSYSDAIITAGRSHSGDLGPMTVKVRSIDVGRILGHIPSVNIIHIAVVIIIDAVVRYFSMVHPEVILQVFMVQIDGVINHTNHNGIASGSDTAGGDFPSSLAADICTRSACAAVVIVVPLSGIRSVIRGFSGKDIMVELDQAHIRMAPDDRQHPLVADGGGIEFQQPCIHGF